MRHERVQQSAMVAFWRENWVQSLLEKERLTLRHLQPKAAQASLGMQIHIPLI